MAGTAVPGRLTWQLAELVEVVVETPRDKTIVFDVPSWPGHRTGQHVDVRLTAEETRNLHRASKLGGTGLEPVTPSLSVRSNEPSLGLHPRAVPKTSASSSRRRGRKWWRCSERVGRRWARFRPVRPPPPQTGQPPPESTGVAVVPDGGGRLVHGLAFRRLVVVDADGGLFKERRRCRRADPAVSA
jgi:hypothetical protein